MRDSRRKFYKNLKGIFYYLLGFNAIDGSFATLLCYWSWLSNRFVEFLCHHRSMDVII
jgi:hypothetical protein